MAKNIWIWKGKTLNTIMSEFKFKITQSSGYSYEYTVRANEKLDAFAKARTTGQGKSIMLNAIRNDMETRFGGATADNIWLEVAYTKDEQAAEQFVREIQKEFPGFDIVCNPLSLSVACHIGPGALAIACCKKMK